MLLRDDGRAGHPFEIHDGAAAGLLSDRDGAVHAAAGRLGLSGTGDQDEREHGQLEAHESS